MNTTLATVKLSGVCRRVARGRRGLIFVGGAGNAIGRVGATALAEALRVNASVTALDLYGNDDARALRCTHVGKVCVRQAVAPVRRAPRQ